MRDGTAAGLIQHLDWAAEKGLMPRATAMARRAAAGQVLEVQGELGTVDLKKLDLDLAFEQFVNLRGHDFTPASLQTYRSRLKAAVTSYLSYVDDPSNWKPPARTRKSTTGASSQKRSSASLAANVDAVDAESETNEHTDSSVMAITFPLARSRRAVLRLPSDLDAADVRRLTALLATLPIDEGPG